MGDRADILSRWSLFTICRESGRPPARIVRHASSFRTSTARWGSGRGAEKVPIPNVGGFAEKASKLRPAECPKLRFGRRKADR
jgi:hypothetical protein